jgi:hypothetical protein
MAVLASAFAVGACTEGVTPDCSDAQAQQCIVVVEVPEAAVDASEEGGAMPDAQADAPLDALGPGDAGQADAHEAGSTP